MSAHATFLGLLFGLFALAGSLVGVFDRIAVRCGLAWALVYLVFAGGVFAVGGTALLDAGFGQHKAVR